MHFLSVLLHNSIADLKSTRELIEQRIHDWVTFFSLTQCCTKTCIRFVLSAPAFVFLSNQELNPRAVHAHVYLTTCCDNITFLPVWFVCIQPHCYSQKLVHSTKHLYTDEADEWARNKRHRLLCIKTKHGESASSKHQRRAAHGYSWHHLRTTVSFVYFALLNFCSSRFLCAHGAFVILLEICIRVFRVSHRFYQADDASLYCDPLLQSGTLTYSILCPRTSTSLFWHRHSW